MIIDPSISLDGDFNINCANSKTGSIEITPVNNVGAVDYRWADGIIGNARGISRTAHTELLSQMRITATQTQV